MAKQLSNLKDIYVEYCDVIEEVVSNRDDDDKKSMYRDDVIEEVV